MKNDENQVREGRLSFPSGHASLACFGAVFAILYIQVFAIQCNQCNLMQFAILYIQVDLSPSVFDSVIIIRFFQTFKSNQDI